MLSEFHFPRSFQKNEIVVRYWYNFLQNVLRPSARQGRTLRIFPAACPFAEQIDNKAERMYIAALFGVSCLCGFGTPES
jgi:hypothetical protein